jgi:hypothetical protein
MLDHYKYSDKEFLKHFKNATLEPKYFNHEAHIRLAWIHIDQSGIDEAIKIVCNQIFNYAKSLGVPDKFNKTVTIAAVKAVNHFMKRSRTKNFKDFMAEHSRLKYNFKDLLAQHYDIDIFNLEIAKSSFLEPDLLPFD